MLRLYNRNLNVSPFVIVPVALTNHEASLVVSSRHMAEESQLVIQGLYGNIASCKLGCPIIGQTMPFARDGLVIANTVRTNVPDAESGRKGLKLTYGALIKRHVFSYHSNVCTRTFDLLDLYLQMEFGWVSTFNAANEIVALFQNADATPDGHLTNENFDEMLNRFESDFTTLDRDAPSWVQSGRAYLNWRNARKRRLRPTNSFDDVKRFWACRDSELSPSREKEKIIWVPIAGADLSGIIRKMARSRGVPDEMLLRMYIDDGIDRDLAALMADPTLEATARVLGSHFKSDDDILGIVSEIRSELASQDKRKAEGSLRHP